MSQLRNWTRLAYILHYVNKCEPNHKEVERIMRDRKALKKGIIISLMAVSLLFSFTSVSLADEKGGSMGGMNMGGSSTTQTAPAVKNSQDSKSMSTQPQSSNSNATSQHEVVPGMDSNMEGMQESSGGHGESSGTSEGVNWIIVGGFLAINTLILIIAGVLKSSRKVQPQL